MQILQQTSTTTQQTRNILYILLLTCLRSRLHKWLCLIDFGESFTSNKHLKSLEHQDPIAHLNLSSKLKLVMALISGRLAESFPIFSTTRIQILGNMPEPWWSTTWVGRKQLYQDHPDKSGKSIAVGDDDQDEVDNQATDIMRTLHPSVASSARSLSDKLLPRLWYFCDDVCDKDYHREISPEEIELFSDRLGRLLTYVPEKRTFAMDALKHGWLNYSQSTAE
jgi:hypothetical protein